MKSRYILAAVLLVLLALSFAGIGYAYNAVTENTGNTSTSEYVVLSQTSYTLANEDLRFDIIDTDAGKVYRLLGANVELVDIDGRKYYGVQIGGDNMLTATKVGGSGDTVDITIESPVINGGWFTDFSDQLQNWRYVLRIVDKNDTVETNDDVVLGYAYYDGSEDGKWTYLNASGVKISKYVLTKDKAYTVSLFFAGVGEYGSATFRAVDSLLKLSGSVTVCPVWNPATESEDVFKCTFKSGTTEPDRVVYMEKGSNFVLPENLFTSPTGSKFVGWDETDGKTWMPWHTFKSNSKDREFTAIWESDSSKYKTITFASNGGTGTMADQYVGNDHTYTLPMCTFTKTDYLFAGWTVTATDGVPDRDYSGITDPFTDIPEMSEGLTLTAKWEAVASGCLEISMQETPIPSALKYIMYSDAGGKFTLSDCIFSPPANLSETSFKGWEFLGWTVFKTKSNSAAQSYTMPDGVHGYLIKEGTIKFKHQSN